MVHIWQKLFHNENYIATDNKNPNFAIIAKAYGIQTIECYGINNHWKKQLISF